MQQKSLIATSILAASCFAVGCTSSGPRTAQSDREQINPSIASSDSSWGGTQSERERESGVPLPEGSSQAGTTGSFSQGDMRQEMSSVDRSYGGSQSERERESGSPLQEGSS